MILLKRILFLSFMLFSTNVFSNICVNTSTNYKMFGAELRSGILFQGQHLAFGHTGFKNYQTFSADDAGGLSNQVGEMTNDNCSVVLGLFTSSDCLIAGPMLYKNKIVGISPSCSTNKIKNFYPYLYTAVPPLSKFNSVMINYLNNDATSGKIFFIYQPTDVYSTLGYEDAKDSFHKPFTTIIVDSDGRFDPNSIAFDENKVATFVFFTYPLPSAQIILELSQNGLLNNNVNIIGASSWVFDVSVFKPIKNDLMRAKSVTSVDILNWPKVRNSEYVKNFVKTFKREPLTIELLNYDVARLAVNCYRKSLIDGVYKVELFEECISSSTYHGVAGGFSFKKGTPFASRPLYIGNFISRLS